MKYPEYYLWINHSDPYDDKKKSQTSLKKKRSNVGSSLDQKPLSVTTKSRIDNVSSSIPRF